MTGPTLTGKVKTAGTGLSLVVVRPERPQRAGQTEPPAPQETPQLEQEPAVWAKNMRSQTVRGSIAVGLVLLLAGVLFVTNIRSQNRDGTRGPSDLAELILAESERVAARQESVDELRAAVDELTRKSAGTTMEYDQSAAERLAWAADAVEVAGPGIAVELSDAPADALRNNRNLRPDDLVVHQQDLQSVVNALWAGGAEAMTIQGQRVSATSAVRCVGNTLMLHGRLYSPPYRIEAIGPQDSMIRSLERDKGVQLYMQYVDVVGLGWSEETLDEIEMPAYDSSIKRAGVPADVDVLGTLENQVPLEPRSEDPSLTSLTRRN